MPRMPSCSIKGLVAVAVVAMVAHSFARTPKGELDFPAASMGWRAAEFQNLTNQSREKLAAEVQKYREAGGKGDPAALLNLAVLHERGIGLITNKVEAAKLVRQAAEMGFAPAQNQLGLYFSDGVGVAPDAKEALRG